MDNEFEPTPEQRALQKTITKVASELEKKLGPVIIELYEQRRAADSDPKVFIGALHMCLCCMIAKVYGISSQSLEMDGTNLSRRDTFIQSVTEGTNYFIDITEKMKPAMMVDALLKTMQDELRSRNQEKPKENT